MKQITVHDAFILTVLFCIIALLFQCHTMDMSGKKSNKRVFGEKHREFIYPYEIKLVSNEPQKVRLWGKNGSCPCGLVREDFEAYVAWKTEGLDIDHIKYRMKKHMDGKECIGWAWIFVKKEAKDEED